MSVDGFNYSEACLFNQKKRKQFLKTDFVKKFQKASTNFFTLLFDASTLSQSTYI